MEWLSGLGYAGVFIGSFLASTVVPMSAEVLLVGMLAAGGDKWLVLALATSGNWLGGMTSYGLGWLGKWRWLEKWFGVTEAKLEKQKSRITKYGVALALFTWLPVVGDIFAIGLGFYRISPRQSAVYMLIGRLARFLVWMMLYDMYGARFFG